MRRTLSFLLTAVYCVFSAAPSTVFAQFFFYDNFNKSDRALVGTTPNIGGAWTITGTDSVNPIQIVGNKVALTTEGQDANAALPFTFNHINGWTLYTGMDLNLSAAQAGGDYFSAISDPGGVLYQQLGAVATTGGYFLQLAATGGGVPAVGTTVLSYIHTYHLDVSWLVISGSLNDLFEIRVDSLLYLSKTWNSVNPEPTQIRAMSLRQGTAAVAPTLSIDNLTFDVPEPSTLMLLGVGAISLLGYRKAKSHGLAMFES
jgi:hypothetical protein